MADAMVFFVWSAGWCFGLWVAWRLGIRDAKRNAPRKCRGVKLWHK